jgi:hypothetical protein
MSAISEIPMAILLTPCAFPKLCSWPTRGIIWVTIIQYPYRAGSISCRVDEAADPDRIQIVLEVARFSPAAV